MLRYGTKYKEIIFGVLFGVGASLIDVAMHATMRSSDFLTELIHPTHVMAAYRFLFLAFGVLLGVLLWLKNRSERDFRKLFASFDALRKNVAGPAMLVHADLQAFLLLQGDRIPADALAMIRGAYENSTVVQRMLTDTQERW